MSDELQMKIGELRGRQAMLEARLTMFEAKFDKKLDEIMAAINSLLSSRSKSEGGWKAATVLFSAFAALCSAAAWAYKYLK